MTVSNLPATKSLITDQGDVAARQFNRAAWIVLAAALGLIFFSAAQKIYRFTLPTDGWAFVTGEIGGPDQNRPIYTENLLNLPSPLQPGDRLLAVEGRSFETIMARVAGPRPPQNDGFVEISTRSRYNLHPTNLKTGQVSSAFSALSKESKLRLNWQYLRRFLRSHLLTPITAMPS